VGVDILSRRCASSFCFFARPVPFPPSHTSPFGSPPTHHTLTSNHFAHLGHQSAGDLCPRLTSITGRVEPVFADAARLAASGYPRFSPCPRQAARSHAQITSTDRTQHRCATDPVLLRCPPSVLATTGCTLTEGPNTGTTDQNPPFAPASRPSPRQAVHSHRHSASSHRPRD